MTTTTLTLFCLVRGEGLENVFKITIGKDNNVNDLKKIIRNKKPDDFSGIDLDKLSLWKVNIPFDEKAVRVILNDKEENVKKLSLPTDKIRNIFTEKLDECIHVLIESPASTVTTSEMLVELKNQISALREQLKKPIRSFEVIAKGKSFTWLANLTSSTMEDLKNVISTEYKPKKGDFFNFIVENGEEKIKYYPINDSKFREMLGQFAANDIRRFIVSIESPSIPFNELTFSNICKLYGLGKSSNPQLNVFPKFEFGRLDLSNEKSQQVLQELLMELRPRLEITPFDVSNDITKFMYIYSYLIAAAKLFKGRFEILPGNVITGKNGHGPIDFSIDLLATYNTVGNVINVTKVKENDFKNGVAQNVVQLESSWMNLKRKFSNLKNKEFTGEVFGIVTDGEKWYSLKCTMGNQEKLEFKLSNPVFISYQKEDMVGVILSHIAWILDMVLKQDEREGLEQNKKKKCMVE